MIAVGIGFEGKMKIIIMTLEGVDSPALIIKPASSIQ
jgi:hypothetical protein